MAEMFDALVAALQLAGFAGILYGAVLALEIDLLIDRSIKARPARRLAAAA